MDPAPKPAAIEIVDVSKVYSRRDGGKSDTLKDTMVGQFHRRAGARDQLVALEGISLRIERGEAIGLIGNNGSGKSTLLKLIAGITEPSRGSVTTHGRVLGLIELGAGFHPELTAEENVFLQGAIYGIEAATMRGRLDAIFEFTRLADFRHMPVKHFSTGMFMRLGFAVAIHSDPDILLIDEVLSVGDQTFQELCLREIFRLREQGVTLVFVTHHTDQAERFCDRIGWLEKGRLRALGTHSEVLPAYYDHLIARRFAAPVGPFDANAAQVGLPGRFGSGEVLIEKVRMLNAADQARSSFHTGESLRLEIDYVAQPGVEGIDCAVPISSIDGSLIAFLQSTFSGLEVRPPAAGGRGRFVVEIPELPILSGRFEITIGLAPPGRPSDHFDLLYKLFYISILPDPNWDPIAPITMQPQLSQC